jgi:PAS domain S-box-containing protein
MAKIEEMSPGLSAMCQLVKRLTDTVILLDPQSVIVEASTSAHSLLSATNGMRLAALTTVLGAQTVQLLQKNLSRGDITPSHVGPLTEVQLPDGQKVQLWLQKLEENHWLLQLRQLPSLGFESLQDPQALYPAYVSGDAANGLLKILWESAYAVVLQDENLKLVDVNPAFLSLSGYFKEELLQRPFVGLLHGVDSRLIEKEYKKLLKAAPGALTQFHFPDWTLVGANGQYHFLKVTHHVLGDAQERRFVLTVMQDATAEYRAREQSDAAARELDDWFELSPLGMLVFDAAGLILRANAEFGRQVGTQLVTLLDASASLQQLLGWGGAQSLNLLAKGAEQEGWVSRPDGTMRRMRARVRACSSATRSNCFLAVIQDLSIEDERELAQLQIGALMDTAGVGLATFQESSGWVRQSQWQPSSTSGPPAAPSAALQAISRDIVLPESLPAYEKLQQALRLAQRAEVRYAVHHPELGVRWLLTRVEPAVMASGKRTTSVVTLDITEQQQTLAQSERLLHELTTIMESMTAGIAYIRGDVLMRCNRRFESILGVGHANEGGSIRTLLGNHPVFQRIAREAQVAFLEDKVYETEFQVPLRSEKSMSSQWYAVSIRRTATENKVIEAIVVLSDITRLKSQQLQLEVLLRDRELMFNLSEVGFAFIRNGHIQRANNALAEMSGYSVAQLDQSPIQNLFSDSATFDSLWNHEMASLRTHGRWSGERLLRRRDAKLIWVQVSKRMVNEEDPGSGVIASYVNVDDRHRAEQAVTVQAERTRAILDSVLVGIVIVGPGGIEWMNRSARRMSGGDLSDFTGQPMSKVATPELDHPFRQTHYLDDLGEGEVETFECRMQAMDGRTFWVVGNAVMTGRENAGPQLTYALLDIDRRRSAEANIALAQASLKRIIEAAPLAIALFDAKDFEVLQINDVANQIGGLLSGVRSSRRLHEYASDGWMKILRADMEAALVCDEVSKREYVLKHKGQTRIWDAQYLPLASPGNSTDQLLLVATDVTEQRAAQQAKFEAALEQREMLVKEVHHRIKNNLQGVAGLLQQIAQRRPEVAGVISEVVGQVQAIAQVYGLQVGMAGPLRIHGVVEAITLSVSRTFGHGIDQQFSEAVGSAIWALPEAESIPIALSINELLTNAVKHGVKTEKVQCELFGHAAGCQVLIRNRGQLPEGFNLSVLPSGVAGLGLVKALLPRRGAKFSIVQQQDWVEASIELLPPALLSLSPNPD